MSKAKSPLCSPDEKIKKAVAGANKYVGELAFLSKENTELKDKIDRLETELARTRKALEIAVDALKLMYQGNGDPQDIMRYIDNRWTPVRRLCKQTLEQITALEQKDVK